MGQTIRKGEEQTGLTEKEKKLIRDSWDAFCSEHRNYGVVLFSALFIKHPEYQQLFRHFRDMPVEKLKDSIKFRTHACAVGGQLTTIVETLDEPELLEQVLRRNAQFHTNKQGVKPEHFVALGRVVIETMTASNENAMTPAAVRAWEKLFEMVNDCTVAVFEAKSAQSSSAEAGVASRKMSTHQSGAPLPSSGQNAFQPPHRSQPDAALPSGAEPPDSDKSALPPTSGISRKSSCLSPARASSSTLSEGAGVDRSATPTEQALRRPSSRVSIFDEREVTSPGADEATKDSASTSTSSMVVSPQSVCKEPAPPQECDSKRRSSRIRASIDSGKALSPQTSKISRKASVQLPAASSGPTNGGSLPPQEKAKRRSSRQSISSPSEKPISPERTGSSRRASYASPTASSEGRQRRRSVQRRQSDSSGMKIPESITASSPSVSSPSASSQSPQSPDKADKSASPTSEVDVQEESGESRGLKNRDAPSSTSDAQD